MEIKGSKVENLSKTGLNKIYLFKLFKNHFYIKLTNISNNKIFKYKCAVP